jgi:hypothetical protein
LLRRLSGLRGKKHCDTAENCILKSFNRYFRVIKSMMMKSIVHIEWERQIKVAQEVLPEKLNETDQ